MGPTFIILKLFPQDSYYSEESANLLYQEVEPANRDNVTRHQYYHEIHLYGDLHEL